MGELSRLQRTFLKWVVDARNPIDTVAASDIEAKTAAMPELLGAGDGDTRPLVTIGAMRELPIAMQANLLFRELDRTDPGAVRQHARAASSLHGVLKAIAGIDQALDLDLDLVRGACEALSQLLTPEDYPDSRGVIDQYLGQERGSIDALVVLAENRDSIEAIAHVEGCQEHADKVLGQLDAFASFSDALKRRDDFFTQFIERISLEHPDIWNTGKTPEWELAEAQMKVSRWVENEVELEITIGEDQKFTITLNRDPENHERWTMVATDPRGTNASPEDLPIPVLSKLVEFVTPLSPKGSAHPAAEALRRRKDQATGNTFASLVDRLTQILADKIRTRAEHLGAVDEALRKTADRDRVGEFAQASCNQVVATLRAGWGEKQEGGPTAQEFFNSMISGLKQLTKKAHAAIQKALAALPPNARLTWRDVDGMRCSEEIKATLLFELLCREDPTGIEAHAAAGPGPDGILKSYLAAGNPEWSEATLPAAAWKLYRGLVESDPYRANTGQSYEFDTDFGDVEQVGPWLSIAVEDADEDFFVARKVGEGDEQEWRVDFVSDPERVSDDDEQGEDLEDWDIGSLERLLEGLHPKTIDGTDNGTIKVVRSKNDDLLEEFTNVVKDLLVGKREQIDSHFKQVKSALALAVKGQEKAA